MDQCSVREVGPWARRFWPPAALEDGGQDLMAALRAVEIRSGSRRLVPFRTSGQAL